MKSTFKRGFAVNLEGSLSALANARQAINSNRSDLLWYAIHAQDLDCSEFLEAIEDKNMFCVAESASKKLYEIDTVEEFKSKFNI